MESPFGDDIMRAVVMDNVSIKHGVQLSRWLRQFLGEVGEHRREDEKY